jgi:hypothetical protein
MEIKREVYLDGAILINVLLYIENRIRNGKKTHSYTLETGAYCTQTLASPSGSSYSVGVDLTYTMQPRDPEEAMEVHQGKAMSFSGIQLTNSRVMITGQCYNKSDFPLQRFNELWDDLLKTFGTGQPERLEGQFHLTSETHGKLEEPTHSPATQGNRGKITLLNDECEQIIRSKLRIERDRQIARVYRRGGNWRDVSDLLGGNRSYQTAYRHIKRIRELCGKDSTGEWVVSTHKHYQKKGKGKKKIDI